MLKAVTGKEILWLTRVCQVAWKFGNTPRDWQTGSNVRTTEGYYSLVFQKTFMPNALKRNA